MDVKICKKTIPQGAGTADKFLISIPAKDTSLETNFSVFDKEDKFFYASTRLGTLIKTDTGFEVEVPEHMVDRLNGKTYKIKAIQSMDILDTGKIIPDTTPDASAEETAENLQDGKKKKSREVNS